MNADLLRDIAHQFGTPVYSYDAEFIQRQFALLEGCLPECIQIFYSVKANPLLSICQILREKGCGIEVASSGELLIALEAGYSPESIIFTSPGKTVDELKYAVEKEIYCINIESIDEAEIINQLALVESKTINVAIRINPNFNIPGSIIKMSGVSSQFGIDQEHIGHVFEKLSVMQNIKVIGVHVYSGTQILNAENLVTGFEETIKLAIQLSETYNFDLDFLDLGGGFGVPYFSNEKPLDTDLLKLKMVCMWKEYGNKLEKTRVIVESGRFLLAESGVYMTKVLYVKECKGAKYAICDGGSNHHASSAFLGRHIRNNFPIYILNKDASHNVNEINIVGHLCTPTDVLGQKVVLPFVEVGDLIIIEKSGAYGLTHSPTLFLSHECPAEVLHYNGELQIIRKRGKKEDVLRNQVKLPK